MTCVQMFGNEKTWPYYNMYNIKSWMKKHMIIGPILRERVNV